MVARRVSVVVAAAVLALLMMGALTVLLSAAAGVAPGDLAPSLPQAGASPKPGDPGGNSSKPGDNDKKKDDNDQDRDGGQSDSRSSSSRSDTTTESSVDGPGHKSQTESNNRWTPDGTNRSVDTRVTSPHQSHTPRHRVEQPITGAGEDTSNEPVQSVQSPGPTDDQNVTAPTPEPDSTTTSEPTPPGRSSANPILSALGDDAEGVQALVDKAEPLQRQIEQLRMERWTVRYRQPSDVQPGSFADYPRREIVIDENYQGDINAVTQTLSHEVGHAIYGDGSDFNTKEAYVNSMLANEGAATMNNIQTREWIRANGGPDIGIAGNFSNHPDYEIAYNNYIRSDGDYGKATGAIGNIFANGEHPSGAPDKTYYQYYGDWYDQTFK